MNGMRGEEENLGEARAPAGRMRDQQGPQRDGFAFSETGGPTVPHLRRGQLCPPPQQPSPSLDAHLGVSDKDPRGGLGPCVGKKEVLVE